MTTAREHGQFAQRWANWTEKARYRISQFFHGWRASVTAQDLSLVEQVLSPIGPEADRLFRRMPIDAQAHSLRVMKALQAEAPTSSDLAAAALLHDVGKVAADDAGAYLGLWLRGPIVLLEAWRPDLLVRLASSHPAASLRYALFVQLAHPQIGAAWAEEAGCSPLTCWLIANHQDTCAAANAGSAQTAPELSGNQPLDLIAARKSLARLQRADGRN
jgi:hypothetical protein